MSDAAHFGALGLIETTDDGPRIVDPVRRRERRAVLPVPAGDGRLVPGTFVELECWAPDARVRRVLAPTGSGLASMLRLAASEGLDLAFPPAVQAETEALLADPGLSDPELVDQRELPFVTIDGPGTRDLDQAVAVRRRGSGFTIEYAIADAAHACRPGSALFEEALRRGATYYLPGLSIPMLPRALSEGVTSLGPDADRRALLFSMDIEPDGSCTETRVTRIRMRSRAQLTFGEVQAFLDGGAGTGDPAVDASLQALGAVGENLLAAARARDVVFYRRTEVKIRLRAPEAGDGMGFAVIGEVRDAVEQYNEQISLLCNTEAARLLRDADTEDDHLQPIYRVHAPPKAGRVEELERALTALCHEQGLDPARWSWHRDGGRSLSRFLAGLPDEGPHARLTRAIRRQAIMINVRSEFSERPGPHHGIGADVYGRFTSPMREMVGVFLHRELIEHLAAPPPPAPAQLAADEALRDRVIEVANSAKQRQRQLRSEANRLVLDRIFERAGDRPLLGTVMGLTPTRVHGTLDEPPVDVKMYGEHLREWLGGAPALDDTRTLLRGPDGELLCRLGDAIRVRVADRVTRRGQDRWVLLPVREPATPDVH